MPRLAPCKGCPDRTTGDRVHDCHDTCERYAEYKASCIAANKARAAYEMARTASLEGRAADANQPAARPQQEALSEKRPIWPLWARLAAGRGNTRPARQAGRRAAKRRECGEVRREGRLL